jgi:hypothetical protein
VSELDEYGAEFYLGDPTAIGAACAAWRWHELRTGSLAQGFVGFPDCLHPLDVLHLSRAIADASGRPEVPIDERLREVAGEEGLWSAEVMPEPWLCSVAEVPDRLVGPICERWAQIIAAEYDMEWDVPAVVAAFPGLVHIAKKALATGLSVVTIWQQ